MLIGYARVSTVGQDLTAQCDALLALGVDLEQIFVDHGLTGTNRSRPGPERALAACRAGDTLVVTKLDRLARSLQTHATLPPSSSARVPRSVSVAARMTPATQWAGSCSTCLGWSQSSKQISFALVRVRAWPSPEPRAAFVASSRSSRTPRKHSSSGYITLANTPRLRSQSYSESRGPRSIERSIGHATKMNDVQRG